MSTHAIRWIQRFNNFKKAFSQLNNATELAKQRKLSELEQQGLIQTFEYTHELAWKTLKDFLGTRGVTKLYGSKDTTREAFKTGLVKNGETWMEMILSRNLTSHTYDEETAAAIAGDILNIYFQEFTALKARLEDLALEESP